LKADRTDVPTDNLELLEMAIKLELIRKHGANYNSSFGLNLGKGQAMAREFLDLHPETASEIREQVAALLDYQNKGGTLSSRGAMNEDPFAEKISNSDRRKIAQILAAPISPGLLDFFAPEMICMQLYNPAARLKLVRGLRDRAAGAGLLKHAPWLERMLADPFKTMVEPEPFQDEDEYLRLVELD
jgi:hypothetical protein